MLNGQLSRRMVLAMTGNSAFNGTHNKNPFNFQHFGLNHLAVNYGGKKLEPFNPDFTKEDYIRSYMSLFDGTGAIDKNVALSIRYGDYPEGFAIWCFDFTPEKAGDESLSHPLASGNVEVTLRFSAATTEVISLIV